VWWCHVGLNVGFEVFGKGSGFTRPVLIFRKYSSSTFLGIPLTTKYKESVYRYPMDAKGKQVYALMEQVRAMDARRLNSKIEKISETQFRDLLSAFIKTISDP
jgi:mRNA interferase MazF